MAKSTMIVKTRGFRECEKVLSQLPRATSKNVLRKVGKPPMEAMAAQAAALAPHRRGVLSFSISVSEKGTRRATWKGTRNVQFVGGRFTSERAQSIVIAMGPASGLGALQYASFGEFGTIDTPAQPFMRPTWDAQAQRALDYVQEHLWLEVSKAAERRAGRLAKAR